MPKIQYLHKTRQGIPDIYAQMFGDILQNMNFSRYYRNRGKFIYGFDPNIIVYDYNSIEVANAIMEDREPELLSNITAHILRHTACARMAESGMDQRTLQEIMGHSNLAITMKVYNHVDDKCMRDEIERFDAKRDGKNKV